jgi:hypothetical protein
MTGGFKFFGKCYVDIKIHEEVRDRIGSPVASAQGGKSNKRL